jgi:hypothetical protein
MLVRRFSIAILMVFILLSFLITACRKDLPTDDISKSAVTGIPLLYCSVNDQGSLNLYSLSWDIKKGSVVVGTNAIANLGTDELDSLNLHLIWDGNKTVLVSMAHPDNLATGFNGYNVINLTTPPETFCQQVVYKVPGSDTIMISYIEEPSQGNSNIVVETRDGNTASRKSINVPANIINIGGFLPIMIFGTPSNYTLLVAYDQQNLSSQEAIGKLLLATVQGDKVDWKEVYGSSCSFIAGAGAREVKTGNKVFINSGCNIAMVVDLDSQYIKLSDYKPINDLYNSFPKDDNSDNPDNVSPRYRSYQGLLLVSFTNRDEERVWALKDDQCIGEIRLDKKQHKISAYKAGNITESKELTGESIILPLDGCGTWQ